MAIKDKIEIITIKKSSGMLGGNYKSNFSGDGIEFHDLKMYDIGDDIKNIDWINTAKHNKVFVKKRIEEKEMPALFVFDISLGMNFSSGSKTKLDTSLQIFDILSNSLINSQDPYGFIFFDQEMRHFEGHKKGIQNSVLIRSRLEKIKSSRKTSERSDIHLIISSMLNLKIKNNIIFLITDSLDITDTKGLTALCKLNDVILIHVSDDFENDLDSGGHVVLSSFGDSLGIDLNNKTLKEEYIKLRKNEFEEFKRIILKCTGSCLFFSDSSNIKLELYNFFRLRNKIYK